ncbi:hypothetical protein ARALYDRAFT_908718 [Arabidopsis lyrata subsp. lyrata]|uniref:Uncharacterized protein n=1 Tax=Arabidopsis lyrata subsp. lyrata TaxID=81972 RepID=D7M0L5_ARALL|nr:hypothetical protein ARALYDRAFT_908718 [Arabidopsis lyrata subsp. lyrata]
MASFVFNNYSLKNGKEDEACNFNNNAALTSLNPTWVRKQSCCAEVEKNGWPAIEGGNVKPVIHKYLPLSQAAEAHSLMESSNHIGKILFAT